MNKKGWTHFSKRSLCSFLFGIVAIAVGILPFLRTYGKLEVPVWESTILTEILLVLGSLLVLMNAFRRTVEGVNKVSLLIGVLIAVAGLLPLLLRFNVLRSLPFVLELSIPSTYLNALLVFFGIYLFFEAIVMKD